MTIATGGNPPKPAKVTAAKPKPTKPRPLLAYSYRPDGKYVMDATALGILMDVETRARNERGYEKMWWTAWCLMWNVVGWLRMYPVSSAIQELRDVRR